MKDHLTYFANHRPRLPFLFSRRAEKWLSNYSENCEDKGLPCERCPIYEWCGKSCFGAYLKYALEGFFCNWWENIITWWFIRHPDKKVFICSQCGFKQRRRAGGIRTGYGWRKEHGKWICHHCYYHANDDWDGIKGGHIPHEQYVAQWAKIVEENNAVEDRDGT